MRVHAAARAWRLHCWPFAFFCCPPPPSNSACRRCPPPFPVSLCPSVSRGSDGPGSSPGASPALALPLSSHLPYCLAHGTHTDPGPEPAGGYHDDDFGCVRASHVCLLCALASVVGSRNMTRNMSGNLTARHLVPETTRVVCDRIQFVACALVCVCVCVCVCARARAREILY